MTMADMFNKLGELLDGDLDEMLDSEFDEFRRDVKRVSEEVDGKERIVFDKIFDNGISTHYPTIGGTLKNAEGNVVADIEHGIADASTFEINVRLVIKEDIWDRVEVVCGGNALDVDTSPMPDGRYKVRKRVNGYKPAVLDEEYVIELRKFNSAKEFMAWVETLDTDNIRALRQIYYDKWNFDSGDDKDRLYYALLDDELQGRKK
jgi:hypothetical protein